MVLHLLKSGYSKVKGALSRTRSTLGDKIRGGFSGKLDDESFQALEQVLYEADLGVDIAVALTEHARKHAQDADVLPSILQAEIVRILGNQETGIVEAPKGEGPTVILVVGVNGNGKTTSVAKIARHLTQAGKSVLLGAADTFRAAAVDQLERWAQTLDVDIVKGSPNSDPAAVAFDSVSAAKARGADFVIIDTAGRLHTKTSLMQELQKIRRVCNKVVSNSPHETLLVLDATTGQNAIDQANTFNTYTPLTGLVLTKLDGTARGGVVISIQKSLQIPVKFIGVGEGADDLIPYETESFVKTLF